MKEDLSLGIFSVKQHISKDLNNFSNSYNKNSCDGQNVYQVITCTEYPNGRSNNIVVKVDTGKRGGGRRAKSKCNPVLAWISSPTFSSGLFGRSWQNQETSFDFVQSGRDKETKRSVWRAEYKFVRPPSNDTPSSARHDTSADLKVTANAYRGSRKQTPGEMNSKLRLTEVYRQEEANDCSSFVKPGSSNAGAIRVSLPADSPIQACRGLRASQRSTYTSSSWNHEALQHATAARYHGSRRLTSGGRRSPTGVRSKQASEFLRVNLQTHRSVLHNGTTNAVRTVQLAFYDLNVSEKEENT
ncbi:hypothetical protein WN51_13373 [Melipona quadrifasciata]|uniref:Uncharacterized protein n=1 Tax=Melipona quadrifasciata TaxID=166423 RepID=A0A0M9A2F3_9HYME|nr:hypothetical protein WN51_13373 [Melipona quadrifasciata]